MTANPKMPRYYIRAVYDDNNKLIGCVSDIEPFHNGLEGTLKSQADALAEALNALVELVADDLGKNSYTVNAARAALAAYQEGE